MRKPQRLGCDPTDPDQLFVRNLSHERESCKAQRLRRPMPCSLVRVPHGAVFCHEISKCRDIVLDPRAGEFSYRPVRAIPIRSPWRAHEAAIAGLVRLKPSSSQPVTPPIIIFTGKPSRARRTAALFAPLQ